MQTKRPSHNSIYKLGDRIIKSLFTKKYKTINITYQTYDIIKVIKYVSKSVYIPYELKLLWCDAIQTIYAVQNSVHNIGVRGCKIQQQNKQAIISSMIILDNEINVKNNGIINNIAPHKSRNGKNKFIANTNNATIISTF